MPDRPNLSLRGPDAISPTAHYTGHVWVRNGLSHPELATREGRLFFESLQPVMQARRLAGEFTLEQSLLGRHRLIDDVLAASIDEGSVTQVVEIAAGMSARGWRFCQRYAELTYVEADLPAMAQRKRRALDRIGPMRAGHRVEDIDALRDGGEGSLEELVETLDPARGIAFITEGLLTYLDTPAVLALWRRLAAICGRFAHGLYLSDLRLSENAGTSERIFYVFLSAFVRGSVRMHFESADDAAAALLDARFERAQIHTAGDPAKPLIHVLDARTD